VKALHTVAPQKLVSSPGGPEAAGASEDVQPAASGERYDDLGHLIRQTLPGGARSWTYTVTGHIHRYRDADGGTYAYEYTSWNAPSREVDPLGNAVSFRYTSTEDLAAITDPEDNVSEYVYDLKGRLAQVCRHGVVREQYRYDQADNLIEKVKGNGAPLLSFKIGPGNLKTVRHLASGGKHTFAHDEQGRPVRVATDDLEVLFKYDVWGHRTEEKRDGAGV
jgi:YD repeat-containing protein